MKKQPAEKYPRCLPLYFRIFLVLRKLYRQMITRILEKKAKKKGPQGIVPDGNSHWPESKESFLNNPEDINKSAQWIEEDMVVPAVSNVHADVKALKSTMDDLELRYCSPAGTFVSGTYLHRTDRTKNWEVCWTLAHSDPQKGEKILDIGGASTIFSFYLANLGCSVDVIDNDWGNCGTVFNTNYVAKQMNWDLKAYDRDISNSLPFKDAFFDKVYSICVIEHLPSRLRHFMMKEIRRVLKPRGMAVLTFDYDHGRDGLLSDKGLRYAFPKKIRKDVIEPSGLSVYGNDNFIDAIDPKENFLGVLFLKKQ